MNLSSRSPAGGGAGLCATSPGEYEKVGGDEVQVHAGTGQH
jgi:hypothetical protein